MMNYPNPFKLKEPLNNPMTAGMGMQLPPPIQQPKVMPPLEPVTPTGGAKKRKQQTKGTNPKKKQKRSAEKPKPKTIDDFFQNKT